MPNSHYFVTEAASLVDDAVTSIRNRGFTREHAVKQAAQSLGVPESRAKALLYGKVFAVAAEEYRSIKARFLAHLDAEAEYLSQRAEAARMRRREMERDI